MICLAVFIGGHFAFKLRPWHRLRTWLALFGAGLWGHYAHGELAGTDALMGAYIAIDLAAAAIILIRPAGIAQKAIGFCFAIMVLTHIGILCASAWPDFLDLLNIQHSGPFDLNMASYDNLNTRLGWAQFLILFLWSCDDVGKAVVRRFRPMGAMDAVAADNGTGRK